MAGKRVVVPVSSSSTLRKTVEYAVERALEGASTDEPGLVRFVYVHSTGGSADLYGQGPDEGPGAIVREEATELLDRVAVWAEEDAGEHAHELTVETAQIGADEYLFGPDEVAQIVAEDALAADAPVIVMDPGYDPGIGAPLLQPLESVLERDGRLVVDEAPVTRQVRRTPLASRATPIQLGTLFGISYVFYQLLGGSIYWFDLVTGAVAGTIVAVGLAKVTFNRDPDLQSPIRVARMLLYAPYLLWEIVKSNVQIAAVILHPRLPIEPRMTRIRPAVWGALPLTTLANSITLTPGTLTVRVDEQELIVHTLVPPAREDLFDGGLERAVRFVFYGRRAARIDSPRDRGDTELLQPATGGSGAVSADGGQPVPDVASDAAPDADRGDDGGEQA